VPTISRLQPVAPPAQEVVSLDLVKRHLRIDNDDDDTLLPTYIAGARAWAEDYLGRAIADQQYQWWLHEEQYTGAYPYLALPFPVTVYPLWYPWPNIIQGAVSIPRAPVKTIDAVSYGMPGQDDVTLTSDQYSVDPRLGRFRIIGGAVPSASDHIGVTFTAGYDGAVPPGIISAVLMLTAMLYENRGDQAESGDAFGSIPSAVKMLLSPHRRVGFGG
jgi:hypothetical protein